MDNPAWMHHYWKLGAWAAGAWWIGKIIFPSTLATTAIVDADHIVGFCATAAAAARQSGALDKGDSVQKERST